MNFKSEAPLPKIINTSSCVLTPVDTEVGMWSKRAICGVFGILFGVMEAVKLGTAATMSLGLQKAVLESKDWMLEV